MGVGPHRVPDHADPGRLHWQYASAIGRAGATRACMRSRVIRRFGLPFAAVLALAATAPGTAVASFGTLSYRVRGPVSAPADGERAFTASCPAGAHVLGGGQYVLAADRDAIVHSSAPFDGRDANKVPDDGWRSRVD